MAVIRVFAHAYVRNDIHFRILGLDGPDALLNNAVGIPGGGAHRILVLGDAKEQHPLYAGGKDISAIRENQLAAFRRDQLGFVFQDFNLLDTFSLKDNILLPLVLQGMNWREMEANLLPIANQLRIANLLEKYPYEVSGGQKQRAAVCRALITHPRLILADEPTGALDSRATDALLDVFQQINLTGQTLLMVTHSLKAASRAGRILFIRDGQVYHQLYRGEMTNEQFYEKISDALTVMTRKDAMDGEMA